MKAIMVMFDSLNRHFLPNYGCDWTVMPQFQRLSEKTLTFDCFYGGWDRSPGRIILTPFPREKPARAGAMTG